MLYIKYTKVCSENRKNIKLLIKKTKKLIKNKYNTKKHNLNKI